MVVIVVVVILMCVCLSNLCMVNSCVLVHAAKISRVGRQTYHLRSRAYRNCVITR